MWRVLLLIGAGIGWGASARSADAEPRTPAVDSRPGPSEEGTGAFGLKRFAENSAVTDAKLKADAGSLSRFSLRASLTYSGPPVGDLAARDQPNPEGIVAENATAITGSAGGRFRFDSERSLSLTTGISQRYPFREGQRFEASNPYVSYSRAFRWGDVQLISTPGLSYITNQTLRRVGQFGSASYAISSIYEIPGTTLALGLDGTWNFLLFRRPYARGDGKVRRTAFSVSPTLKWNFSPRWNLYGALTFAYWNPRTETSRLALRRNVTTAKVGLGWAVTRDIYCSPYLGFFPGEAAWRTTSLNFAAVVSVL